MLGIGFWINSLIASRKSHIANQLFQVQSLMFQVGSKNTDNEQLSTNNYFTIGSDSSLWNFVILCVPLCYNDNEVKAIPQSSAKETQRYTKAFGGSGSANY